MGVLHHGHVAYDDTLKTPRWIIPAHGEREIDVKFSSKSCGTFDKTLHFEAVGSGARYAVNVAGKCTFPSVSVVTPPPARAKSGKQPGSGTSRSKIKFGAVQAMKPHDDECTAGPHVKEVILRNDADHAVEVSVFGLGVIGLAFA